MKEVPEAKSLRWIANMFPLTKVPLCETDKISNAIHIYCKNAADKLEALQEENEMLLELCRYEGILKENKLDTWCDKLLY